MIDEQLARIEEQLAKLEEIVNNVNRFEDKKIRAFVKEEIGNEIMELNRLFHLNEFDNDEVNDRFLSLLSSYNRKVKKARDGGLLDDSGIDVILI